MTGGPLREVCPARVATVPPLPYLRLKACLRSKQSWQREEGTLGSMQREAALCGTRTPTRTAIRPLLAPLHDHSHASDDPEVPSHLRAPGAPSQLQEYKRAGCEPFPLPSARVGDAAQVAGGREAVDAACREAGPGAHGSRVRLRAMGAAQWGRRMFLKVCDSCYCEWSGV